MSNIVIVGGQLHNKGAQAMVYTVVDQMKRRFPEKKIIVFASVFKEKDELLKNQLNFELYPWTIRTKMNIIENKYNFLVGAKEYLKYKVKGTNISKFLFEEIKGVLENTDLIIDVSGYALSSQRGYEASVNYLYNIIVAEKYNIPMILMPQSFGPFDYSKLQKKIIMPVLKEKLQYPLKIYTRENEGYEFLKQFGLKNMKKSLDIVLQGEKEYNIKNIFKNDYKENIDVNIPESSVAIIPNDKIMKHGDPGKQYSLYKKIIDKLLVKQKNVYLIYHSNEDFKICEKIKKDFQFENKVILINKELECIDIDSIIGKFDFIIGSRYHSIVHAYKSNTPAFVFGWAIKYQELMKKFNQDMYLYDVRVNNYKDDEVLSKLDKLLQNFSKDSIEIKRTMTEISKNNIFNNFQLNFLRMVDNKNEKNSL